VLKANESVNAVDFVYDRSRDKALQGVDLELLGR
jgi:hypothetical protein